MSMTKIAVTIDKKMAKEVDRLVASGKFASRSNLVRAALERILKDLKRSRLAAECAKLDPEEEQAMAEEETEAETWPEY